MDRFVVDEARGLNVEGVEVGLVMLLQRPLPGLGVLPLPRLLRLRHLREWQPLLLALVESRLRGSLAELGLMVNVPVLARPLRLLLAIDAAVELALRERAFLLLTDVVVVILLHSRRLELLPMH